jgi:hypothetical protein
MTQDPKKVGFNYGAALGAPRDTDYDRGVRLFERLTAIAHAASDRAWRLNMRLRDVRHACDYVEQASALATLFTATQELSKFSPETPEDPTPNYSFEELASIDRGHAFPGSVAYPLSRAEWEQHYRAHSTGRWKVSCDIREHGALGSWQATQLEVYATAAGLFDATWHKLQENGATEVAHVRGERI